jgi:TP901 family phage tail tape measure protein
MSVSVTADLSQAISEASRLTATMDGLRSTIANAALENARFNSAGQLLTATVRGVDTEGRKFSATVQQLGPGLVATGIKFDQLNKSALETKNRFEDVTKALNQISGIFQRFVEYKALNLLNDALKDGFNAARDFQVQISLIRTISQDNQLSFGTWAKNLKTVSDELGIGITQTSKAAYDAVSNQVAKGSAVIPFLKEAGELARTTGGTIEEAGNTLASVINAYGKSSSDAREISATLFQTIDEGRVVLKDLANNIGPVNVLAKGLGISFEEVAGSIAFLTQKGIASDIAMTFLRNVFVQLEKPSEALANYFKTIGVESGKAAIATYGFSGILDRIQQQVAAGNTGVAQLFPEIRAQQPIQAALNDLGTFDRIIAKSKDTSQAISNYQKAIDIRGESPADYINKEFNKLKNTFTADIGQNLTNIVKDLITNVSKINEYFTGDKSLAGGLKTIIRLFADLTIGIIAFRTASTLAAAGQAGLQAALAGTGASATKGAIGVGLFNRALASSVIGLVAAGAAILISRKFFVDPLLDTSTALESFTDSVKKLREEALVLSATKVKSPFADFSTGIKKDFEGSLQGLAGVVAGADESLNHLKEKAKETQDSFKNIFATFTDALKKNINEIGTKITEAKDLVKKTMKEAKSFADPLNKTIDDLRLQNLQPGRKIDFIDQQLKQMYDKINNLYAKGDKDSIEEANKLYKEAESALVNRYKAQQELFKQNNPNQPEAVYQNKALEDLNPKTGLEKHLGDLEAARLENANRLAAAKKLETAELEKQQAIEKLRVRNLEDQFKKFNQFNPFDAEGKVKKEFKSPLSGRIDLAKTRDEFEKEANALRTSISQTGNVGDRIQVENLIAQVRKEKLAEFEAIEKAQLAKTAQQKLLDIQKEYEQRIENNKKIQTDAISKQTEQLNRGSTLPADVSDIATRGLAYGGTKGVGQETPEYAANKSRMEAYKIAANEYAAAIRRAKEDLIVIDGKTQYKPENIKAVGEAIDKFKTAQRQAFIPVTGGANYSQAVIPGAPANMTFGEFEKSLDDIKNKLFGATGIAEQNPYRQDLLKKEYTDQVQPELSKLDGITQLNVSSQNLAKGFESTLTPLQQFKNAIDALQQNLKAAPVPSPRTSFTPNATSFNYPTTDSDITYAADGGWIGWPARGRDRYPVMGAGGEYMVNSESAAMFPDTLEAINKARRGSTPNILGGNVSNQRIGDIYITVNETKDGQDTSRQVWNKIRREFRRGTI